MFPGYQRDVADRKGHVKRFFPKNYRLQKPLTNTFLGFGNIEVTQCMKHEHLKRVKRDFSSENQEVYGFTLSARDFITILKVCTVQIFE